MPRRTDGLYQRRGYFYFKFKTVDGEWHEHATRTQNYAEARSIRTKFLADVEEGKVPTEMARWTLKQAVEHRLATRKCRLAPGSFASEATITRTLLRVLKPDARLQKLAAVEVIHEYETSRLTEGACAKSVNNEVVVLAGILRDAKLWRRVEPDYKHLPTRKSDIPDALSKEEAHRLLQVVRARGEDAVAAFAAVLAYATGMRSREIQQLQLGAIRLDSEHPQIQVKRATTKSNKGARFVALDSMACWAVRKLLTRAERLGAIYPEHYLLPTLLDRHTRANDPLHGGSGWDVTHPQTSWAAEWNVVRKQARIEHRRFHDLRHSYITRAAEAGVPLLVIERQVGHMSKEMIDHYAHISQAAVHRAAELMERQNPDLPVHLGLLGLCGEGVQEEPSNGVEPKQERVGGRHKSAGVQ
jgi:integrase